MVWALANLVVAYVLVGHVDPIDGGSGWDAGVCFLGFSAMALLCARSFSRVREEQ